jgi:hypothetical protein
MRHLDFFVWFFVGCAWWSCKPLPSASPEPTPDPAAKLAEVIERVERIAPVALAACSLAAEDKRPACEEAAHVLAAAAAEGRAVLHTLDRCREEQDEECLALAVERASELVRVLR